MAKSTSESDPQLLLSLQKRVEAADKEIERLKKAIELLPQPVFTSSIHEHTYDTCIKLGLTNFRMIRAPNDYYEWTLERRRDFLGAASIHQLCKTILLENTKCTVKTCNDKNNSRFYAIIIQYTSRLQTQNLFKFVRGLIPGASRNHYHFRAAKPEDVAKLTMSEFNGVCPVGNKVEVPIILSARLLDVPTGFMWVGGGEPDLKLGFPVQDFIKHTGCFVTDIAEDGLSMDDDLAKEAGMGDTPSTNPEPEAQ